MKTRFKGLLVLSVAGVAMSSAAQASPLRCTNANAGFDNGYAVVLSGSIAAVSKVTIAGETPLASLPCDRFAPPAGEGADVEYISMHCEDSTAARDSFVVTVEEGGFTGSVDATLSGGDLTHDAKLSCFTPR